MLGFRELWVLGQPYTVNLLMQFCTPSTRRGSFKVSLSGFITGLLCRFLQRLTLKGSLELELNVEVGLGFESDVC